MIKPKQNKKEEVECNFSKRAMRVLYIRVAETATTCGDF